MELKCPICKTIINPENINITTNLAKCEKCNIIHKAVDLLGPNLFKQFDNPPKSTKILIKNEDDRSIEFSYPKKGISFSALPIILFTLFWFALTSFLTHMTWSGGSIFFVLLLIPFWIMGFAMLISMINTIWESQTIKINNSTIKLIKNRPIYSESVEIPIINIQSIRMKTISPTRNPRFGDLKYMIKTQRSFADGMEVPTVIADEKTIFFFEGANDAEQEWITLKLEDFIKKK